MNIPFYFDFFDRFLVIFFDVFALFFVFSSILRSQTQSPATKIRKVLIRSFGGGGGGVGVGRLLPFFLVLRFPNSVNLAMHYESGKRLDCYANNCQG